MDIQNSWELISILHAQQSLSILYIHLLYKTGREYERCPDGSHTKIKPILILRSEDEMLFDDTDFGAGALFGV